MANHQMKKHRHQARPGGPAGQSQRQLRVGEELRHALSAILARHEAADPVLQEAVITVTEVRVSPDLRNATAFVMPLGGAHVPEVMSALARSASFLRGLLAKAVPLRYAPMIHFELDTSFEHASRIDALLHQPEVVRDLAPHDGEDPEEDDGAA